MKVVLVIVVLFVLWMLLQQQQGGGYSSPFSFHGPQSNRGWFTGSVQTPWGTFSGGA